MPHYEPPERLNVADHFLDARVRERRGDRPAIHTNAGTLSYRDVQTLANQMANLLVELGAEPEERVVVALPDSPEWAAAFFGTLKLGGAVVMLNPGLPAEDIARFLEYTRARTIVTHRDTAQAFREAAAKSPLVRAVLVIGEPEIDQAFAACSPDFETFPSHRDDAAIWLFSGGTTGRPKAVVQTHRAFAYTTECYAKGVLGYRESDITLSVPKLFFGYAMGSNLLFPFAAGASTALFSEPSTPESIFARIARHKPTILINVPTMIQKMVSHADAKKQDLKSLRLSTSAGEALPAELFHKWRDTFGVDLLDGLGTAEMWHIFISNQPGRARAGTIGEIVPGFDVKACNEEGREVPAGETGYLWVRGGARAIGYWQNQEKTEQVFRGDWYVSGDLIQFDRDGYVTYHGRGDEMLKVGGKWLAPADVEGCLLQHPLVAEACVVGVADSAGLMKPVAYVVAREQRTGLAEELKAFALEKLEPYKHPREVIFLDALPRTHLGKVDRGKLRRV